MNSAKPGWKNLTATTAWTDICSCNICIHHIRVDYAGAIAENWFADLTFPFPVNLLPADVSWTLATGLEIIAPLALILGLATRFFSLALMLLTVVAIATVHSPAEWHSLAELWKGYAITNQGYGTPNCR